MAMFISKFSLCAILFLYLAFLFQSDCGIFKRKSKILSKFLIGNSTSFIDQCQSSWIYELTQTTKELKKLNTEKVEIVFKNIYNALLWILINFEAEKREKSPNETGLQKKSKLINDTSSTISTNEMNADSDDDEFVPSYIDIGTACSSKIASKEYYSSESSNSADPFDGINVELPVQDNFEILEKEESESSFLLKQLILALKLFFGTRKEQLDKVKMGAFLNTKSEINRIYQSIGLKTSDVEIPLESVDYVAFFITCCKLELFLQVQDSSDLSDLLVCLRDLYPSECYVFESNDGSGQTPQKTN